MLENAQATLDELFGHAVEGIADLAESVCPALHDYLSWELREASVVFVFEDEMLPPNIATVFSSLPAIVHDWLAAAAEIVAPEAARAA